MSAKYVAFMGVRWEPQEVLGRGGHKPTSLLMGSSGATWRREPGDQGRSRGTRELATALVQAGGAGPGPGEEQRRERKAVDLGLHPGKSRPRCSCRPGAACSLMDF